jgi:hypothetical protein
MGSFVHIRYKLGNAHFHTNRVLESEVPIDQLKSKTKIDCCRRRLNDEQEFMSKKRLQFVITDSVGVRF